MLDGGETRRRVIETPIVNRYTFTTRPVLVLLVVLLLVLQHRLWTGDGGVIDLLDLGHQITRQKHENDALLDRNKALQADVEDLKKGVAAIEERARSELGMIKENETFYQAVVE